MTTIAIKDGLVAADTQLSGGNYVVRASKLFRLPDGGVATACGEWGKAYPALLWLQNGEQGEAPDFRGADITIVRPDHTIELAYGSFPAFPIMDRIYASGCGYDLARSAMARGLSPLEAVQEAVGLDEASSEPIQTMQAMPVQDLPGVVTHKPRKK
jgi:hypothetical protein